MKDEIKEILDNFKIYEDRYKKCNETQFIIFYRDIHLLLDYITNLQNENMKYDQCLTELTDNYKDMQKELTNLQEENEYSDYCNEKLREKIANLEYKITNLQKENERLKEELQLCKKNGK